MKTPDYSYYLYTNEYGDYVARCVEDPDLVGEGASPSDALADVLESAEVTFQVMVEDEGLPDPPAPYPVGFSERIVTLLDAVARADKAGVEGPLGNVRDYQGV